MGRVDTVTRAHGDYMGAQLERNGVVRLHGHACFDSPRVLSVVSPGGRARRVEADIVVIAAGSRPRRPPEVEIDHEHVFDSDSILSMTWLPRSLVVLGGGVIACEFASIFATLGVAVTVVDRADRPMPFLDTDLTAVWLEAFEALGGTYRPGVRVEHGAWDGAHCVIALSDGTKVEADKALCALGRVANVDRLAIDRAGVQLTKRGLVAVNAAGRTNVEHIWAVGDVTGSPSLASTAMEQGRRAVCHALGLPARGALGLVPTGIYTIPERASVGLTEQQAREQRGGCTVHPRSGQVR